MTVRPSNVLLGWPIYSDPSIEHAPTLDGGAWYSDLPRANVQDRRLALVARSMSTAPQDTRMRVRLGRDCPVRVVAIPKSNLSKTAKVRFKGVPSTMLFDYEAGDDISALGGTFARTPTDGVRTGSYIDRNGVLRFAAENRAKRSEELDHADWVKTNGTIASTNAKAPNGLLNADTFSATSGNATAIQDLGTLASAQYCYSAWIKLEAGGGNIQMTLDGGSTWTTVAVTSAWTRLFVTQTLANPDVGIRLVTLGASVSVWGQQVNLGATPDPYVKTTSAATCAPRDAHYINGVRHYLHEGYANTNICLQSENFGVTWSAPNSGTRVAAADTDCGVSLDLLGDSTGGAAQYWEQTISFTGDAPKAISLFVRQATSAFSVIRLLDVMNSGVNLFATLQWSGGLPVVAPSAGAYLGYEVCKNGKFRLLFSSATVTASHTNNLQVFVATDALLGGAQTGTLYVGGVQVENAVVPSSYNKTTTASVTRNAETLSFPFAPAPQSMTVVHDAVWMLAANPATNYVGWAIGGPSSSPYALGRLDGTTLDFHTQHHNGSTLVTSDSAAAPSFGHRGEMRSVYNPDGSVLCSGAVDAGTEFVGIASAANAFAGAWAVPTLNIGTDGGQPANFALRSLRIAAGVQTFATMRALVYDSGWITPWPDGLTADDLDGMNIPAIAVLTADAIGADWWFEIDDADNAAGYIDVHRFVVCGGLQPEVNFAPGADLGLDTDSIRAALEGGAAAYLERPVARMKTFTLKWIDANADEFHKAFRLQRIAGTTRQLMFVSDPTKPEQFYERAFLGVLAQLSRFEYPTELDDTISVPFAIREEL